MISGLFVLDSAEVSIRNGKHDLINRGLSANSVFRCTANMTVIYYLAKTCL